MSRRRSQLMAYSGAGATALLFVLMASGPPPPRAMAQRFPGSPMTPSSYLGNEACRECHQKEFKEHKGSNHSQTLRPASSRLLGDLMPPIGPISGTPYAIFRDGDGFSFGLSGSKGQAKRVEMVFGSGKTGVTFASVGTNREELEFRMSRIPSSKSWYITPGQEGSADIELGMLHTEDMSRRCIGCHATGVTKPAELNSMHFGVGCESCHGPGKEHIDAARIKGNPDLRIEQMSRWNARQINTLCARCHRSENDVSLVTRDASSTQRFQPYGLMMSPCFKKSGERISCKTCHSSHGDVSTDKKHYESICLSCHSPAAGRSAPPGAGKRPCPVNPKEKCVSCHMPTTQIFPGSKLPVKMSDHMIWAYGRRKR